ncbi:MAG: uncharacterized protein QOD06_2374 [Candidatus Binatota bacterium]|nr:uncharacterized protein [Candidatus Binatota bacterium]
MVDQTVALRSADELVGRILAFSRMLRESGLAVTPGRIVDAARSLPLVGLDERDELRLALRTNFASSREEEQLFDRAFDGFWNERPRQSSSRIETDDEPAAEGESLAAVSATSDAADPSAARYGRIEADAERDLRDRWPGGSREFDRAIDALIRSLATRRSRRYRAARRGPRVDFRRSLRRSAARGADVHEIVRARPKIRKTRLILLYDVSGSMADATSFLLRFLLGVQRRLPGSRSAVFSTRFTEVTRALRRRGVAATLEHLARAARHWSGGTDIGGALAVLNRGVVRDGSARSTICLIVSDGYDHGDPERIAREMALLSRRVRRIVWINPLFGTEGYQPLARGMHAALPWIDRFLPGHDVRALRRLTAELGAM